LYLPSLHPPSPLAPTSSRSLLLLLLLESLPEFQQFTPSSLLQNTLSQRMSRDVSWGNDGRRYPSERTGGKKNYRIQNYRGKSLQIPSPTLVLIGGGDLWKFNIIPHGRGILETQAQCSDTPPIDHLIMREFVSRPRRYRPRTLSWLSGRWVVCRQHHNHHFLRLVAVL